MSEEIQNTHNKIDLLFSDQPGQAEQPKQYPPNRYYTRAEAVEYLKVKHGIRTTTGTMDVWRSQDRGPIAIRFNGRNIYYKGNHLDLWVDTMAKPVPSSESSIDLDAD